MNTFAKTIARLAIVPALAATLGGALMTAIPEPAQAACSYVRGSKRLVPGMGARLYVNDPGSQINIRAGSSAYSEALHYGLSGDAVTVLDSAFNGEDCALWFLVDFDASGARGWVHGNYIEPR